MAAPKPDKKGEVGAHRHGHSNPGGASEGVNKGGLDRGYTVLGKPSVLGTPKGPHQKAWEKGDSKNYVKRTNVTAR